MVGYWQGFPFVTTAAVTATGGVLGVMVSVPLRRALVGDTDLPYPERSEEHTSELQSH